MENGKARLGAYYLAVESLVPSCDKTGSGGTLGGHHIQIHRGLLMHTRTWEGRSSTLECASKLGLLWQGKRP
jgi:hypothetical protein